MADTCQMHIPLVHTTVLIFVTLLGSSLAKAGTQEFPIMFDNLTTYVLA